jgi:hypothetical protein
MVDAAEIASIMTGCRTSAAASTSANSQLYEDRMDRSILRSSSPIT